MIDTKYYRDEYWFEILKEFKETKPDLYMEILQEILGSDNIDIKELERELEDKGLELDDDENFNEIFDDYIRYGSEIVKEKEKIREMPRVIDRFYDLDEIQFSKGYEVYEEVYERLKDKLHLKREEISHGKWGEVDVIITKGE